MDVQDKIILQGLRFYGYHGVLPEEKKLGQWFEVDLELYGPFTKAAASDNVEDTLDYSKIYQDIGSIVEGVSLNLIETLACKVVEQVLTYPLVEKAKVRVKKPQAPLGGPLDYAAVETVRRKKQ